MGVESDNDDDAKTGKKEEISQEASENNEKDTSDKKQDKE